MNRRRALLVLAIVLAAAVAQLSGANPAGAVGASFTANTALYYCDGFSAAWGDYNSDGYLDLLTTPGYTTNGVPCTSVGTPHSATSLYTNDYLGTPGTFSPPDTTSLPRVTHGSAAWSDYNNDGKLEILLTGMLDSGARIAKLYKQNGSGVYVEDTVADANLTTGVYGASVAWGDYNNDGRPDILLSGTDASSQAVLKLYDNNSDGIFTENATAGLVWDNGTAGTFPGVESGSLAWGDYTGDGYLDILVTGSTGFSGSVAGHPARVAMLFHNNADGTFSEDKTADVNLTPVGDSAVAWGDYNNDGKLDILLDGCDSLSGSCASVVSKVYENNGPGVAFSQELSLQGFQRGGVAWGDYDSNGKPDILLSGDNASGTPIPAKAYAGDGSGGFSVDSTVLSSLDGGSVAFGDYDSDRKLDAVLTGSASTNIFRNTTTVTDTAPAAPTNPAVTTNSSSATFSWTASTDAEQTGTPNGLTYNLCVGTTTTTCDVVSPMSDLSTGKRLLPQAGNVGERTSYGIAGLPGGIYHWSVQAVDSGFAGSPFATEGTFTVPESFAFSAAAYSVGEGGSHATITITRSGSSFGAASVHFATSNGSATAGSDYTAVSQTVSFAAGETSKTVSVPITDDSSIEPLETVSLSLSSPSSGATLGSPHAATLTISDNDRAIAFSSGSYSVNEGDGTATITINRAGLTSGTDSVHFATANGTATAGSDYTAVSQTVSFAKGDTSKTVSIPITDDSKVESSETVLLSLSSPSAGATLASPSSATLTISDNDAAPPPNTTSKGKISSCKLSKKSFSRAQAGKVKLTCKFSPKSKVFKWALSLKQGKKWTIVKRVNKSGSFKKVTLSVKKLFRGKAIKRGAYRLKLSADKNSKTLKFKVA